MEKGLTTWAEINLDNIRYNLDNLKSKIKKDTKICCVLKANAYGHGSVEVAKYLESQNVDYFSVSRIDEALELRNNDIKLPILSLGYTPIDLIEEIIKNNISITVYSLQIAQNIDNICKNLGKKLKVHIKVDTGMNRLGFHYEKFDEINEIFKLKNLIVEGIFTHLATADEIDRTFSILQYERFEKVISNIPKKDIIIHFSNSANAFYMPHGEYDMIRYGISLYGYKPDINMPDNLDLKPALTLKCRVSNIKTIKKCEGVSYGLSYIAKEDELIATITIGYADGFFRGQDFPKVIIKGEVFDVVGRICMDQCMVKINKEIDIKIGEEVILFSIDTITATDVAKRAGTIPYEILTSISNRVQRIYIKN